jgi:hypothetical protein
MKQPAPVSCWYARLHSTHMPTGRSPLVWPSIRQLCLPRLQIFDLMRSQELLSIPNMSRMRRLNVPAGVPQPGAIIALALHDENQYYGTLWVAYDATALLYGRGSAFLTTLAGQAAWPPQMHVCMQQQRSGASGWRQCCPPRLTQ